jgi:hypothetical protein
LFIEENKMILDKVFCYGKSPFEICRYNYSLQGLPEYPDDCLVIQKIAFEHGFDISLSDADELWSDVSGNYDAHWLVFEYFSDAWKVISPYFIDIDELEE